jgi:hypothetical protein
LVAALSPLAAAGAGAETFTGTAAAALKAFAAAGAGVETFAGTAAAALKAFAAAAAAGETFTGTAAASVKAFAAAGAGAETFTGTAAAALSPLAAAGAGGETFTGTAAAALAPMTADATGAETFAGTAAATLAPLTVDATGGETFTGTAAATLAPFAAAGVGTGIQISYVNAKRVIALASNRLVTVHDTTRKIVVAQPRERRIIGKAMQIVTQPQYAELPYVFDWTSWLEAGETIALVEWFVGAGLEKQADSQVGSECRIYLKATGTHGNESKGHVHRDGFRFSGQEGRADHVHQDRRTLNGHQRRLIPRRYITQASVTIWGECGRGGGEGQARGVARVR